MSKHLQSGVSLVELMIWMTLSLIILTVIGAVYGNAKQSTRVSDSVARLQENGRFVLYLLDQDLRTASFRGCGGTAVAPVNVLNSNAYPYRFDIGVAGFRGTGSGFAPALDATIAAQVPAPSATSDVLTVRLIDGPAVHLTARMASGTDVLQVAAGSRIAAGDVLLVADCAAAAIFVASDVTPAGVISHDLAQGNVFGNGALNLQHAFGPDASVYRLVTRTYYVAPSVNKPGTTSLWSMSTPNYRGTPQPSEIGEGIESIRLTFGEDTDGDRAANRYLPADTVGNWANVVSVKPQVLLATTTDRMATTPQPYVFNDVRVVPTDTRVRSVLASAITLRNRVP